MDAVQARDPNAWMTSGAGHPRRWGILAVLVICLLVVVLDNTVLNIALPVIQRDLDAAPNELLWAIDSYILVFSSLLFTWGVLGDRFGRRKVLIIGLITFGVASAICAFSVSSAMLIGFRAVMGIGGAAVLPTTLAIITVVFPPHERGRAIGMWAGAVGAAVALGPVLGGMLLAHPSWSEWLIGNDWGSVFFINVPIVAVGLYFVWRIVPETRNPHARRLDIPGPVLSFSGLALIIYGIIDASSTRDWLAPSVLIPVAIGVLLLAVFLSIEARSTHASFDVSLFRNRGYAVSLSAASLAMFTLSGIIFTLPFYLQTLRGYGTLASGLCFLPVAAGQLLAAPRSSRLVARFGYKAVMTTGLLLVAASELVLARMEIDTGLWVILIAFFFFGLGFGCVIAPAATVMQNVLPLARAGAGSAVQNTVRQVFGALGFAVIGTILATQYAANLQSGLDKLPPGVPEAAKQAASESIIATVRVLDEAARAGAPADLIAAAKDGAFQAFLASSHLTTLISMFVVLFAALIVAFLLPVIRQPQEGDRAVGAPADATDALVQTEASEYAEQAAEEYGVEGTERAPDGSTPDIRG